MTDPSAGDLASPGGHPPSPTEDPVPPRKEGGGRDRYADALRAGALLVVIYGHWLATLLVERGDGHLQGTEHLLHTWEASAWITWGLQVVPLFVFVSAAVNAPSLTRTTERGGTFAGWFRGRVHGLARPVAAYLTVWVAIAGGLRAADIAGVNGAAGAWRVLGEFDQSLTVHLWFIAMIVATQALLPWSVRLDQRASWRAVAGLLAAAAVVDAARFFLLGDSPIAGIPNALLVWMVPQQLGVLWSRATLTKRHGALFASIGIGGLLAGVAAGYPVALVGGDIGDNNVLPPTLMIAAVSLMQAGVIVLAARPARSTLKHAAAYRPVQIMGAVGMPLYLWHKSFEPLVGATLSMVGRIGWVDGLSPADAGFWSGRAVWLGLLTLTIIPFAAWQLARAARAARRPKTDRPRTADDTPVWRVRVAAAAVVVGVFIAMVGGVTRLPQLVIAAGLLWAAVTVSRQPGDRRKTQGTPSPSGHAHR